MRRTEKTGEGAERDEARDARGAAPRIRARSVGGGWTGALVMWGGGGKLVPGSQPGGRPRRGGCAPVSPTTGARDHVQAERPVVRLDPIRPRPRRRREQQRRRERRERAGEGALPAAQARRRRGEGQRGAVQRAGGGVVGRAVERERGDGRVVVVERERGDAGEGDDAHVRVGPRDIFVRAARVVAHSERPAVHLAGDSARLFNRERGREEERCV